MSFLNHPEFWCFFSKVLAIDASGRGFLFPRDTTKARMFFSKNILVGHSFSHNWVVVSKIFYFHPENWGRFPI